MKKIYTEPANYLKRNQEKIIAYIAFIVAALLCGVVAVATARVFTYFEKSYLDYFYKNKLYVLIASPFFFWLASYLVLKFSPFSGGSGIPQVIKAVELSRHESDQSFLKLNSLRGSCVKIVSAVFGLMGGASIGREGPTAQISASIFQAVALRFAKFSPHVRQADFLTAGASAGIAAAFNAPLAGIVFAFEEIALNHFIGIKNFVLIAIIVAGVTAQAIGGNYVYFGLFSLPVETHFKNLLHAIFVGLVCGYFGALFSKYIVSYKVRSKSFSDFKKLFVMPIAFGVLVAVIGYITDGLTFGPGSHVAKEALKGQMETHWFVSPLKMVATAVSFISGMGGGIFAPSLSIGALFGVSCAEILSSSGVALLSLMGMASFLASVTHAPLTAFIIVMEMTDKHSAMFPLMISVFVSYLMSRAMNAQPLYHSLAKEIDLNSKSFEQKKVPSSPKVP